MGKYNSAVITTVGANVIAQALSGTELTWTVMRTSSTAIPAGIDPATLSSLTGIEQVSNITDATVYGNDVLQVSARFANTSISVAYLIQTVGIYGQLAGGTEVLIAVMTAVNPDEVPEYDPDSPSAFIFNIQLAIQNAPNVTMNVNDTGTATVADLNRKVDLHGGDLSDTVVDTFTASTASYPVPAAGDTMKVIGGKVVKFCADIVQAFTGASASAAGKKGLVPAPAAGRNTYYLRGDGTWQAPVNDNTATVAGRVLDARQANPNISGTIASDVKSLSDSITDYVKNTGIMISATLPPGVTTAIKFSTTAPSGYKFLACFCSDTGHDALVCTLITQAVSGVLRVKNLGSSSVTTNSLSIRFLWIRAM